jgi:hypothetical protein
MSDDQEPKNVWLTALWIVVKVLIVLLVGAVAVFGLFMGACYFMARK